MLADRAFSSVEVINALEELGVEYLIKQPHRLREQRFIRRMTGEVAVKQDQGIYTQKEGWGWTTLVAVPVDRHDESSDEN